MTKGEMILKCRDQIALKAIAGAPSPAENGSVRDTVREVRAMFDSARLLPRGSLARQNPYKAPGDDLHKALTHSADTDDLMAMILAARRLPGQDLLSWVAKSGPFQRCGRTLCPS